MWLDVYYMSIKAWICAIVTSVVLTIGLILLFDRIWPDNKVMTLIIPLVVGALITNFIRKSFDFIFECFNPKKGIPFLGVLIMVDHTSRRMTGYGASCGEVIPAGNFKANYEVEVELNITVQNESPYTAYGLKLSYTPNEYSKNYTLIDNRENKLHPLVGNNHFDFTLRILKHYYDVFASDVDKEIYKIGKGISPLNGSKLTVNYLDSKHKEHIRTEIIE